jgi:hypothetical protein
MVGTMTALGVLLGAGAGLGIALIALGIRGVESRRQTDRVTRTRVERHTLRLAVAVGAAVLVGAVTGWPVAALLAAAACWGVPALFTESKAQTATIARVEAVAGWAEMLRDTMAGAAGLEQAIAIDTHLDGTMRNATWRSHVVRPGRPCMVCTRQLDMGQVALDAQGLLDDPSYIAGAPDQIRSGQNVAPLSISVTAALLAQYVSLSVAPGGIGDPGPLQYVLSTHDLHHLDHNSRAGCMYEAAEPQGDRRQALTGVHPAAESARARASAVPRWIRARRKLDDLVERTHRGHL